MCRSKLLAASLVQKSKTCSSKMRYVEVQANIPDELCLVPLWFDFDNVTLYGVRLVGIDNNVILAVLRISNFAAEKPQIQDATPITIVPGDFCVAKYEILTWKDSTRAPETDSFASLANYRWD